MEEGEMGNGEEFGNPGSDWLGEANGCGEGGRTGEGGLEEVGTTCIG